MGHASEATFDTLHATTRDAGGRQPSLGGEHTNGARRDISDEEQEPRKPP